MDLGGGVAAVVWAWGASVVDCGSLGLGPRWENMEFPVKDPPVRFAGAAAPWASSAAARADGLWVAFTFWPLELSLLTLGALVGLPARDAPVDFEPGCARLPAPLPGPDTTPTRSRCGQPLEVLGLVYRPLE